MSTILITGGHKGVGLAAVRRLAADGGHDILLAGRSAATMEALAAELTQEHGAKIQALPLDVSSLAAVRDAATEVRSRIAAGTLAPLGALLLNAGVQYAKERPVSADGYEMTFATNVLGHVLLAHLLLDALEPAGRIVFTASGTHDPTTMDGKIVGKAAAPDAVALARGEEAGMPLSGARRYSTSKLCDLMLAYELDRRLKAQGSTVAAIAFDPGFIPETGLIAAAPAFVQATMRTGPAKALVKRLGVTMGGLPFSGDCLARLATDPAFADAGGTYWQANAGTFAARRSSAVSYDAEKARALWDGCVALAGVEPVAWRREGSFSLASREKERAPPSPSHGGGRLTRNGRPEPILVFLSMTRATPAPAQPAADR